MGEQGERGDEKRRTREEVERLEWRAREEVERGSERGG